MGTIAEHSKVREMKWKGSKFPEALIGSRIKFALDIGIREMNRVGPLPQTEM